MMCQVFLILFLYFSISLDKYSFFDRFLVDSKNFCKLDILFSFFHFFFFLILNTSIFFRRFFIPLVIQGLSKSLAFIFILFVGKKVS